MTAIDALVLEKICEAVHKSYCKYHLEHKGIEYWTKGDYSKLNEEVKEYDRRTVKAVLDFVIHQGVLCEPLSVEEIYNILSDNGAIPTSKLVKAIHQAMTRRKGNELQGDV